MAKAGRLAGSVIGAIVAALLGLGIGLSLSKAGIFEGWNTWITLGASLLWFGVGLIATALVIIPGVQRIAGRLASLRPEVAFSGAIGALVGVILSGVLIYAFAVASLAVTFLGLIVLALAMEGVICLFMAAPIFYPVAWLGAFVGWAIQARPTQQDAPSVLVLLILAMPLLMGAESRAARTAPRYRVETSIEIAAPPAPMKEWSPYREIHAPHLEGFFVSDQGEFRLERLPGGGTRVTGTTWYRHNMWPAGYWRLFSDPILHRIHWRVLTHIKRSAEA